MRFNPSVRSILFSIEEQSTDTAAAREIARLSAYASILFRSCGVTVIVIRVVVFRVIYHHLGIKCIIARPLRQCLFLNRQQWATLAPGALDVKVAFFQILPLCSLALAPIYVVSKARLRWGRGAWASTNRQQWERSVEKLARKDAAHLRGQ